MEVGWDIDLKVIDVKIFALTQINTNPSSFTYKLRLSCKINYGLNLSTKENLNDVVVFVHFHESTNYSLIEHHFKGESENVIGILYYTKTPVTLWFQFYISGEEILGLLELVRHGSYPESLTITLGADPGIKTDGGPLNWDTIERPQLPIMGVSLSSVVARPAADRAISSVLAKVLDEILLELKNSTKWAGWMFGLLLLIAALLIGYR